MPSASEMEARRRWSAGRLARVQRRPAAKRVASQYGEWSRTDQGLQTLAMLSSFGWALVAGRMTRKSYKLAVRNVAKSARLPLTDVRVMAMGFEETIRCALRGTGQGSGGIKDDDG